MYFDHIPPVFLFYSFLPLTEFLLRLQLCFFFMCSMLLIRLPAQAGVRSYLLEQGQLPSSYTTKKDDSSFPGIRQLACSSRERVRTLWSCPRP